MLEDRSPSMSHTITGTVQGDADKAAKRCMHRNDRMPVSIVMQGPSLGKRTGWSWLEQRFIIGLVGPGQRTISISSRYNQGDGEWC